MSDSTSDIASPVCDDLPRVICFKLKIADLSLSKPGQRVSHALMPRVPASLPHQRDQLFAPGGLVGGRDHRAAA